MTDGFIAPYEGGRSLKKALFGAVIEGRPLPTHENPFDFNGVEPQRSGGFV